MSTTMSTFVRARGRNDEVEYESVVELTTTRCWFIVICGKRLVVVVENEDVSLLDTQNVRFREGRA